MQRILAAVRRVLHDPAPSADVHFHSGPHGMPSPCFDVRCRNPRL
jgi:hypothetical protein